jgi:cbb3-type cytochrome oxidase subunit 3
MDEKTSLVERKVDTKLIITSAWIAMMCLYLYCDWFSLFRPGQISEMMNGKMGPFDVSQMGLFSAGLLMVIPSMMILVSALATARIGRIVNLAASAIYFLVNIGNLVGETWAYYYLFGLLEVGLVIFIFVASLRWPKQSS